MVKRVFEAVCRPKVMSLTDDLALAQSFAKDFEANNYNMKKLFKSVVLSKECGQ